MKWFLSALNKYADFDGRASREEYWMFILFNFIFSAAAYLIDLLLGLGFIYFAYVVLMLIPGLAIAVRRLHDIGKSGWMLLVGFIPLIGAIWLLILMLTVGDESSNEYGNKV